MHTSLVVEPAVVEHAVDDVVQLAPCAAQAEQEPPLTYVWCPVAHGAAVQRALVVPVQAVHAPAVAPMVAVWAHWVAISPTR